VLGLRLRHCGLRGNLDVAQVKARSLDADSVADWGCDRLQPIQRGLQCLVAAAACSQQRKRGEHTSFARRELDRFHAARSRARARVAGLVVVVAVRQSVELERACRATIGQHEAEGVPRHVFGAHLHAVLQTTFGPERSPGFLDGMLAAK
jgi:hypothetical protein